MKLSELVAYKIALSKLNTRGAYRSVELELGKVTNLVDSNPIKLGNFNQELENNYRFICNNIDVFEQKLNDLKQQIQTQIEVAEKPWFQESYRLFDEEMRNDSAEYILNRRPILSANDEDILRVRIQNYSDWRFPGMIIRPGVENFIQDLVSYDPLYIVDTKHELLTPAMDRYPEEYQRRLRPYVIKETLDEPILGKIPDGQFGLCLIYNFFEFHPLEMIKKYLQEVYQKLRPGGVLIITFNDCDRDKAVKLVEQHFTCYTPGSLIYKLADSIGYQQIFSWNNDGPSTWLELKKPGTLTSIRGGQTLAKKVSKELARSK